MSGGSGLGWSEARRLADEAPCERQGFAGMPMAGSCPDCGHMIMAHIGAESCVMCRMERLLGDAGKVPPGVVITGKPYHQVTLSTGETAWCSYPLDCDHCDQAGPIMLATCSRKVTRVTTDEHAAVCDVNWGSHGCHHPRGHPPEVPHECPCCHCGEHHPYPNWPGTSILCVARPPYYGPGTRFYGDDAGALGLPLAAQP